MAKRPSTFDNSFSTPTLQPLPNLFSRNRSESRLSQTMMAQVQNPNNTTTMLQLRERNRKSKISVDPELAAAVVKGYLLPMFEAKSKRIAAKARSFKYGTDEKSEVHETRVGTGETVYSDLKLTEQLMSEIEYLRQELTKAQKEARDSKQQLLSNEEESLQLKEKYEKLEISYEFLSFQYNQQIKFLQRSESKGNLFIEQLEKYKKLYQDSTLREEELLLKLHKERADNDIRLNPKYLLNSRKQASK